MKCLFDYAAGFRKKAVQYAFYMVKQIFVVGGMIVTHILL